MSDTTLGVNMSHMKWVNHDDKLRTTMSITKQLGDLDTRLRYSTTV